MQHLLNPHSELREVHGYGFRGMILTGDGLAGTLPIGTNMVPEDGPFIDHLPLRGIYAGFDVIMVKGSPSSKA